MNKQGIMELAEKLASDLLADVDLATTRMEHVRVSSRANAAQTLLLVLKELYGQDEQNDGDTHPALF